MWDVLPNYVGHIAKLYGILQYARNDHMDFGIGYEFQSIQHTYTPDFVVRLTNGLMLILEIKGIEDEQDRAKHQAAQRRGRPSTIGDNEVSGRLRFAMISMYSRSNWLRSRHRPKLEITGEPRY